MRVELQPEPILMKPPGMYVTGMLPPGPPVAVFGPCGSVAGSQVEPGGFCRNCSGVVWGGCSKTTTKGSEGGPPMVTILMLSCGSCRVSWGGADGRGCVD